MKTRQVYRITSMIMMISAILQLRNIARLLLVAFFLDSCSSSCFLNNSIPECFTFFLRSILASAVHFHFPNMMIFYLHLGHWRDPWKLFYSERNLIVIFIARFISNEYGLLIELINHFLLFKSPVSYFFLSFVILYIYIYHCHNNIMIIIQIS